MVSFSQFFLAFPFFPGPESGKQTDRYDEAQRTADEPHAFGERGNWSDGLVGPPRIYSNCKSDVLPTS